MKLAQFIVYLKKRVLIISLLGSYLLLLIANNLQVINWLPPCPIKSLTGVSCVGCGTNRALVALLHGNFSDAFSLNPLGTFLPLCLLVFFIFDYQSFKNQLINPNQS